MLERSLTNASSAARIVSLIFAMMAFVGDDTRECQSLKGANCKLANHREAFCHSGDYAVPLPTPACLCRKISVEPFTLESGAVRNRFNVRRVANRGRVKRPVDVGSGS